MTTLHRALRWPAADEPDLVLDRARIRRARGSDLPAIQSLFETDPSFWEICEGAPPRPTEAAEMLRELPPEVSIERKQVYVVTLDDALVAVVDLIAGFPEPAIYFLGLIFIAPLARHRSLGTRLFAALDDHVTASGGTALRLAVVVDNPAARRLYVRLGFRPIPFARRPRITWTGTTIFVDVLERPLSARTKPR